MRLQFVRESASTSNAGEKDEVLVSMLEDNQTSAATSSDQWNGETSQQQLQQFWTKVQEDIRTITPVHFKNQVLPLARIKKIMKLDEDVKMISAEAPVLFAKAAEIFIHELTLRAWAHTEDNKRRTLQKNDIAMAISKSDQFDFLIDIVPRHEVKPTKVREDPPKPSASIEQVVQTASAAPSSQPQIVLQNCGQVVQSGSSGGVSLMQQIVTPSGELQQMPIQLSQAQLNMIRLQMQNNPNQPILIQAQPTQQLPQILQVSSQAQQPQQQVYLAQVATTQEES